MKKIILSIISSLILLLNFQPLALAASNNINFAISTGVACNTLNNLNSSEGCGSSGLTDFIKNIVNILSYVVGLIAVIMVIVAGINFTTSGGDANKVSSAKSTLVYALIGLVLVALAQLIVRVVLTTAHSAS